MSEERARAAVDRVYARRRRHRGRPLAVRALVAGAGFLLLGCGALLLLPVPEVGLPLLIASLGLLALEFDWAARLLALAVLARERLRRRFEALSPAGRVAAVVVPLAVLAAVVVGVLALLSPW